MSMSAFFIVLIIGIFAGFINVIAGGGSLLTMPVLIFMGLPSAIANGTNRIAIMAQNIVAIFSFRKKGIFHWKLGLMLAAPAIIGSIIGANLAIELSDQLFNRILSIVMIFVLLTILFKPHKKISKPLTNFPMIKKAGLIFLFLIVGFYGGFIQAGVGLLIIATLTFLTNMNLVHINSLKVFIIAIYMASSLSVFILHNQVHWGLGVALAIGTSIGGFLGSHFAMTKGEQWIRFIMIVAVLGMSIKLWFT